MSANVISELVIRFVGEDASFRQVNANTQQGLAKTAGIAGQTAEELIRLAASGVSAGNAFEFVSAQAATTNRVFGDSIKVSQALATNLALVDKAAMGLDSAMDLVIVGSKSMATGMGIADKSAVDMAVALAAAKVETTNLNRSMASQAATGYATKLDVGAVAATGFRHEVSLTSAQIAAMNQALAQTKGIGFPKVPGGGGGTSGGGKADISGKVLAMVKSAGSGLTTYATLPILAAGAASLKFAGDFDTAMRDVNSIAHLSEGDFQALSKSVLGMVDDPKIRQMPKDLAEGLYDIQGRGFQGAQAMEILRQSAIGASAGMTTTLTSAAALGTVINSGITGFHDSKEAMDLLFQEVNLGANNFSSLAGALGTVAPTATAAGVSLQEVLAMYVVLTNRGNTAAQAQTAVNNLLLHVVHPGKDAGAAMHALGIESGFAAFQGKGLAGWLKEVSEKTGGNKDALVRLMPEMRGMKGLLSAVNDGGKAVATAMDGMAHAHDGAGAAARANAEQQKGAGFQSDKMRQEVAKAAIALGNDLLPAERDAIKVASDLAKGFAGLDDETRQTYIRWGLVAMAAGPVIKGVAGIAGGVQSVIKLSAAYDAWKVGQVAANAATATSATAATGAMAGLSTAATVLMGLAAIPIVFTVSYKAGEWIHGKMDEAAKGAGADNTGDWLYKHLPNFNGGGGRTGQDADDSSHSVAPGWEKGGRLYNERLRKLSQTRSDNAAQAAGIQLQQELQKENGVDTAHKKAAKAVADARAQVEAALNAGHALAALDAKKGRKGREETDPMEAQREREYELRRTRDLGPDAKRSDEMRYDLVHRHVDGLGDSAGSGLGAKIVAHANDWIASAQGKASCAAFASGVIKAAGGGIAPTMSARGLRDEAIRAGAVGHPLSEAKPGDLVIYRGRAYGAVKYNEGGETVGYHAGIALGGGRVRSSNDGVVRTRGSYVAPGATATAYTLPGGGKGGSDAEILASARRQLATQLEIERGEEARKKADKARDAAQDQNDAVRDATKEAWRSANEAAREVLYQKVLADRPSTYGPNLNPDIVAQGIAIHEFGVLLDNLPKAIQAALVARSKNERQAAGMEYQPEPGLFDDGTETANENRAKRAKARADDAAKNAQEYADLVAKLDEKRDEGLASTSLAARRAQYVREQVGALRSTGNLATDLERQANVAALAGRAFDATPLRAYRDAIRGLTRELGDVRGQSDEARLAAIRFDADGVERMGLGAARTVLNLQKLIEAERAFRERSRQMGEAAGSAFSDGMNAALDGGIKRGIKAMVLSADRQIREAVVGGAAKGFGAWVTRSMNRSDPNAPKDPGASGGQGGFWGSIGGAISSAMGGGKSAAVVANNAALAGNTATLAGNTSAIVGLTVKLATASLDGGAGAGGAGILGGLFGGGGGGSSSLYAGGSSIAFDAAPAAGASSFVPYAKGGHYEKGVPRLTGERGPEFDIPDHSGTVLPADLTRKVMGAAREGGSAGASGGGGGDTHHYHYSPTVIVEKGADMRSVDQRLRANFNAARAAADRGR